MNSELSEVRHKKAQASIKRLELQIGSICA